MARNKVMYVARTSTFVPGPTQRVRIKKGKGKVQITDRQIVAAYSRCKR